MSKETYIVNLISVSNRTYICEKWTIQKDLLENVSAVKRDLIKKNRKKIGEKSGKMSLQARCA